MQVINLLGSLTDSLILSGNICVKEEASNTADNDDTYSSSRNDQELLIDKRYIYGLCYIAQILFSSF